MGERSRILLAAGGARVRLLVVCGVATLLARAAGRSSRGSTVSTAQKLSVSLPREQVKWAKRMARRQNTTFSGLVSRLIEEKCQHEEALQAFEEYFGDRGRVDSGQAQELRRQWQRG